MFPHGLGPAHDSLHAGSSQVFPERVSRRSPNDIVLEGILETRIIEVGKFEITDTGQRFPVSIRNFPTVFEPGRKVTHFYAEYRRLDIVQKRRVAVVVILAGLPVFTIEAQQGDFSRDLRAIGSHCTSVTEAAQDLEGVKAPASRETKGTCPPILEGSSQALASILDNLQVALLGDVENRIHIAGSSI